MDRKKLTSIGISGPQDIKKILKCSDSLAIKLWYDKANLTVRNAQKIQRATGASLDYLLS